jgi:uncharacterized protein (TIGR02001 family)
MRALQTSLAAALLAALLPAPVDAGDLTLDLSLQSAYIWRSMIINDRPVLQPSLTFTHGGLSASMWANINLTADRDYRGETSEIDYWLAYTLAGSHVDWTFTYIEYTFPHTGSPATGEVWANATWKTAPFAPSLTVVRDVDEIGGWYVMLSGSQALGVLRGSRSSGLELTLNIGHGDGTYTSGYFPDIEPDTATDYGIRLDWPLTLGPGTLNLDAQYTSFTSSGVTSPGYEGKRGCFSGGLSYSLAL